MADSVMAARSVATCPADGLPPEVWGEPVAESGPHLSVLLYLVAALRWFLRLRDDACVEGNMAVQWDPDDLRVHLAPDVFAALGARRNPTRRSYATWVEGKGLDLVFEVTSESTRANDLGEKLVRYQETLGVREYVLFDPEGEWLRPRLRLYRRTGETLEAVEVSPDAPLELETLELDVIAVGRELRLRDRRAGTILRSHEEEARARVELEARLSAADTAQREAEVAQREAEAARRATEAREREQIEARHAAEARVRVLEQELRRLRGRLGRSARASRRPLRP